MIAQPLKSGRRDQIVVFDANAADAGYVQAGLQRDDVAGKQILVRGFNKVRILRMRNAQPVTSVVWEVLGDAAFSKTPRTA